MKRLIVLLVVALFSTGALTAPDRLGPGPQGRDGPGQERHRSPWATTRSTSTPRARPISR